VPWNLYRWHIPARQGDRHLTTFAEKHGYVASWNDGIRSKAKKLERMKGFIKFCMKRKWIAENITGDLEAPNGSSIPPDKGPFTDEELNIRPATNLADQHRRAQGLGR
jgi:site-specific recombinase XerD